MIRIKRGSVLAGSAPHYPVATLPTQFLQLSTFDQTSLIQEHSVDLQCLILSTA